MAKEIPGQTSLWQSETYKKTLESQPMIHICDDIIFGRSLYRRASVVKEKSGDPTPFIGFFETKREQKINGYFIIEVCELNNEKIEGTTVIVPIKKLLCLSCVSADWHEDKRIQKFMETNYIKSYFLAEFVREDNPIEPPAIIQEGNSIFSINVNAIERPPITPFPHINNQKK